MDVLEVIAAIAFCLACALFAFCVVYMTRWVLENAIEIGIALGFLLGMYLAITSAESFATGAPLVALLVLSCASLGCLLRCAFFVFGFIGERAPLTAMRDFWNPSTAYIHVIGAWQYNNVAILRAKEAGEGLKRLQRDCPRRLRVLTSCAFKNERQAITAERMIRRKLRPMHNRGEWFATDLETVLTIIGSLPDVIPESVDALSPLTGAGRSSSDYETSTPQIASVTARPEPR